MSRENVSDLLAFLAVARERSFTRAAAKLGVSQEPLREDDERFRGREAKGGRYESRICCPSAIEALGVASAGGFAVTVRPLDPPPKVWTRSPPSGEMLMGKRVLAVGVADEPQLDSGSAAKRRAFAASLGPLKTCWASGISLGDERVLMAWKWARARRLMDIAEAGCVVAFLVGDGAFGRTGEHDLR